MTFEFNRTVVLSLATCLFFSNVSYAGPYAAARKDLLTAIGQNDLTTARKVEIKAEKLEQIYDFPKLPSIKMSELLLEKGLDLGRYLAVVMTSSDLVVKDRKRFYLDQYELISLLLKKGIKTDSFLEIAKQDEWGKLVLQASRKYYNGKHHEVSKKVKRLDFLLAQFMHHKNRLKSASGQDALDETAEVISLIDHIFIEVENFKLLPEGEIRKKLVDLAVVKKVDPNLFLERPTQQELVEWAIKKGVDVNLLLEIATNKKWYRCEYKTTTHKEPHYGPAKVLTSEGWSSEDGMDRDSTADSVIYAHFTDEDQEYYMILALERGAEFSKIKIADDCVGPLFMPVTRVAERIMKNHDPDLYNALYNKDVEEQITDRSSGIGLDLPQKEFEKDSIEVGPSFELESPNPLSSPSESLENGSKTCGDEISPVSRLLFTVMDRYKKGQVSACDN